MATRKQPSPSRIRYRQEHHAISAQMTLAEYHELDKIGKARGIGWREILRGYLHIPSTEEGMDLEKAALIMADVVEELRNLRSLGFRKRWIVKER